MCSKLIILPHIYYYSYALLVKIFIIISVKIVIGTSYFHPYFLGRNLRLPHTILIHILQEYIIILISTILGIIKDHYHFLIHNHPITK